MSGSNIPNGVREWLEFGLPSHISLTTKNTSEIEGVEIVTGIVGETVSKQTQEFLSEYSQENYIIVTVYPTQSDEPEQWGSMAIKFPSQTIAEEFEQIMRNDGGSLRLSSGKEDDWFLYEAE